MNDILIKGAEPLRGTINVPGDKSISHRAIMLGSLAQGETEVYNFAYSEDCLRSVRAFRDLGIEIKENRKNSSLVIKGKGLRGLSQPQNTIYLDNSGTSMSLILGILAGQPFPVTLSADASLSKRPMKRVTHPLRLMGAEIEGRDDANFAPLTIKGGKLKSIRYTPEIPSAQVKSAIILAGLYADGLTQVTEKFKSRDHTEKMLKYFGAELNIKDLSISVKGYPELRAKKIEIPGDISSASFFLVGAAIIPNSFVKIMKVGINPTRTGIIDVLKRMGAKIKIEPQVSPSRSFEPLADISVETSPLKGVTLEADLVPRCIDELPLLMVAGCVAHGRTILKSAGELRVKETNRINSMVTNLNKMGAKIEVVDDDIIIQGNRVLQAAKVSSFGDHRTAMSMIIAGRCASGETEIQDIDCISTSFPGFVITLNTLKD